LVKTHYSLLAISNVFGWAVIVILSDVDSCSGPAFILTRLDDLQASIDQAEEFSPAAFNIQGTTQSVVVPTAPLCSDPSVFITHAAFAAWDRLVVLATSNGSLHIFSSYALIEQKSTEPLRSIHPASNAPLKMLVPNPSKGGPLSGVIALVHQDGTIKVVDCYDTEKIHWTSERATAAEWSPMGKRLLVGYDDGRLEFLTHDGISKGKIDPPAVLAKEGLSGELTTHKLNRCRGGRIELTLILKLAASISFTHQMARSKKLYRHFHTVNRSV
jgi:WD40 repeat protein